MVRYLVVAEVPADYADAWRTWMLTEHIPAVMATGCFDRALFWRGISGDTFFVEYLCPDVAAFQQYEERFAPQLRRDHAERFGALVRLQRYLMQLHSTIEPPPL
jgi:hypothetical protein